MMEIFVEKSKFSTSNTVIINNDEIFKLFFNKSRLQVLLTRKI